MTNRDSIEAMKKEIKIKIKESIDDIIENVVDDYFKEIINNQPWDIICKDHGTVLSYSKTIDRDLDLNIEVKPCEKCIKDMI